MYIGQLRHEDSNSIVLEVLKAQGLVDHNMLFDKNKEVGGIFKKYL